jgi:hypothetical protein
MPEDGSMMDG